MADDRGGSPNNQSGGRKKRKLLAPSNGPENSFHRPTNTPWWSITFSNLGFRDSSHDDPMEEEASQMPIDIELALSTQTSNWDWHCFMASIASKENTFLLSPLESLSQCKDLIDQVLVDFSPSELFILTIVCRCFYFHVWHSRNTHLSFCGNIPDVKVTKYLQRKPKNITKLVLSSTQFSSDYVMEKIGTLTNLRSLQFLECEFASNESFAHVTSLQKLTYLKLEVPCFSYHALKFVGMLTNLLELRFAWRPCLSYSFLKPLNKLRVLFINESNHIPSSEVEIIARLTNLEILSVGRFSESDFTSLGVLTNLQTLIIENSGSPNGYQHLHHLPHLFQLSITAHLHSYPQLNGFMNLTHLRIISGGMVCYDSDFHENWFKKMVSLELEGFVLLDMQFGKFEVLEELILKKCHVGQGAFDDLEGRKLSCVSASIWMPHVDAYNACRRIAMLSTLQSLYWECLND